MATTACIAVGNAAGAADVAARAAATAAQMTPQERVTITHGIMALPMGTSSQLPPGAVAGAGYVAGVARLGVPALTETDASLGVAWVGGLRGPEGATPLPSGLAMAATFDPAIQWRAGALIGAEAKDKGFNVLLAGGANLMRDPRNGRTFEYVSEDPLLSGIMAGAAISGIQSNHMISTVKHFALNAQESGRHIVDSRISDAAARESDLLAFEIAIERGHPGAVMCAYNRVNGAYACDNDYLLNQVLKRDWHYPGFVMSDWGATPGMQTAMHGLDQQSGEQLDPHVFLGDALGQAAGRDPAYAARLADMDRRILHAIYANQLDAFPPVKRPIDVAAGLAIAEQAEAAGIVLLRNQNAALPLAVGNQRLAVIGGYADTGVLSGGGSSQVQMTGGPAASIPRGGAGPFAAMFGQEFYQRSVPMQAIAAVAPHATLTFTRGDYISDAVAAARAADVAIVFATAWRGEGSDVPDLSLPRGQDALIEAVAEANPHTVVVLETGGPVLMPWLDRTQAVIEAWYPGGGGAQAIADVLFGKVDPGGRLPITFVQSLRQAPRPVLAGLGLSEDAGSTPPPALSADYGIEGSDVGYRWDARQHQAALFPFGFGLSYTSFTLSGPRMDGLHAAMTVANTGKRAGADVAQLYLTSRPSGAKLRLVGFQRVTLAPGEHRDLAMEIDPRLLADWNGHGWTVAAGSYAFATGTDAEHLGAPVTETLPSRTIVP